MISEPLDCFSQAILQRNLRFPTQNCSSTGDIGLALLWVIYRKRIFTIVLLLP